MKITKNVLNWGIITGLFIIPFIAFIVPSAMFFPFIAGKGFAFRIIVEIIFGLYVVLAAIDPTYRPKMSWMTKAVVGFVLAILIADLFGVNVQKSIWSNYERMEGFVLILHLAMYYIVASSFIRTSSKWVQYFNVTIGASVIMCFYSILQLAGKININQGGVRVDATFGNASYLSIYLVFHIFLSIYMLLSNAEKKWQKWAYSLIVLFEISILYFTATRGAILGLIGGLILTAVILAFKERENLFLRKISYSLLIGVVVFVLGFISIKDTDFVKKSQTLSRFASLSLSEVESQGRYFVWPMAISGVMDRPIFGWGQENFNFVFNKYYNPAMFGQEEWFDRTHNVVLDWLIAGGLVGFLAYASMYVALFYYIWRKKSVLRLSEKSVLTGMLSAYIFHNIFVFDNLISYILFFSILAYIQSISTMEKEGNGGFYSKTFSKDAVNYAVFPVVTIFTLLFIYFVNIPAIKANQTLIKAITPQTTGLDKNLASFQEVYGYNSFGSTEATEQLLSITGQVVGSQTTPEIKQQFVELAEKQIQEKIAQTPTDARYLVFAGTFYNRIGHPDTAIKYLERALIESPKKVSVHFELGSSYAAKKDYVKMLEEFKKAYDLNPTSQETKVIYTVGTIYAKNAELFKEMSAKLDPSIMTSDNRILKAFADIGDYNTVVSILKTRLEKDPTDKQNNLSLASAYATMGQKQNAIDVIRAMIARDTSFKDEGEGYIKQIQG